MFRESSDNMPFESRNKRWPLQTRTTCLLWGGVYMFPFRCDPYRDQNAAAGLLLPDSLLILCYADSWGTCKNCTHGTFKVANRRETPHDAGLCPKVI